MLKAGRLLARLHNAVEQLPRREQRPGALPIGACHLSDPVAARVRARFERELADVGYERQPRAAVHGDVTHANVVIHRGKYAHLDYTI